MSFSVNCWLPGDEIWRTRLCKRRFWIMSWKVVAASLLWRRWAVAHLLVVGDVWVYTLTRLCFLNFEVPKVRLCPVSAPPPLNACGKEKFLNIPCTAVCKGCPSSWEPLTPGTTKALWDIWACSQKYEGQSLGFFLELLITKDLQTGQSNVLLCVSVGVNWVEARLLKVSPASSWVLLPPWAAAAVPWGSLNWVLFGMAVKLQKII